jgi:MFS transporter, PPP family, 3-phenylpropionic acid transporter
MFSKIPRQIAYQQLAIAYLLYFVTGGLYLPYFPLYLNARGFDIANIGWLLALNPLTRTLIPPFLGLLADLKRGPRFWGMVAAWGAVLGITLVWYSKSYPLLILGIGIYFITTSPTVPLLDSSLVQSLRDKPGRFGHVRLWGSIGFVVTSFGLGLIYPDLPAHIIIGSLICTHILFALYVTSSKVDYVPPKRPDWRDVPRLLRRLDIVILLLAIFFNRLASAPFYGFYTIFVKENNLGGDVVALTWGLAVFTEVLVMLVVDKYIDRLGTINVMAFGMLFEALRWFTYTLVHSKLGLLLLAPGHGLAFTLLYVASVRTITSYVPASLNSLGQGLAAAAAGGGLMLGLIGSGYLHQNFGSGHMFFAGGIVGVLAFASAKSLNYLSAKREEELKET